jgi:prepilin-type N-terminal cleavage/methylation domain-containing protein
LNGFSGLKSVQSIQSVAFAPDHYRRPALSILSTYKSEMAYNFVCRAMSLPYDPIDGARIMPRNSTVQRGPAGFSLLEVLLVVAVGLILTAVGLPLMNNVIANMKLRASMTSVSGLLQNTRTTAVQQNKTMTAKHFNRSTAPYSLVYYVLDATKAATDNSDFSTTETQVWMEAPITPYPVPTGVTAPAAIGSSTLSFTPQSIDPTMQVYASFNTRGLPCVYSGGTCTNGGLIEYFKDNRISGSGSWAAISFSPAGRIKRWFWNGTAWGE